MHLRKRDLPKPVEVVITPVTKQDLIDETDKVLTAIGNLPDSTGDVPEVDLSGITESITALKAMIENKTYPTYVHEMVRGELSGKVNKIISRPKQ